MIRTSTELAEEAKEIKERLLALQREMAKILERAEDAANEMSEGLDKDKAWQCPFDDEYADICEVRDELSTAYDYLDECILSLQWAMQYGRLV